jgi:hypothetical protein
MTLLPELDHARGQVTPARLPSLLNLRADSQAME